MKIVDNTSGDKIYALRIRSPKGKINGTTIIPTPNAKFVNLFVKTLLGV
ncbi:MAG: hypothetical protein LIP00_03795 [Parabacteroides sp.]|nr:hypothetical protein [Parabacteroides sp.]